MVEIDTCSWILELVVQYKGAAQKVTDTDSAKGMLRKLNREDQRK
jgi:hypothetical protein